LTKFRHRDPKCRTDSEDCRLFIFIWNNNHVHFLRSIRRSPHLPSAAKKMKVFQKRVDFPYF
jgi:hypothetical protein